MDLVTQRMAFTELSSYSKMDASSDATNLESLEAKLMISISQDDKNRLVTDSNQLGDTGRSIVSRLLHRCCVFDSVECAASLLNGEVGSAVPLLNETNEAGMSPMHAAAEAHAKRCVELLLKKRGRTDLKSKDGRGLIPLQLCLCSERMDVIWNPDDYSIEDLVVCLREKDLTVVKLLSEKTKEIDDVAYESAIGGKVVSLAALLLVAAAKVNESILVLHDTDLGSKEKKTIYECVIREALALGRSSTTTSSSSSSSSSSSLPLRAAKRTCTQTQSETAQKRKLLLCEIELLQFFGAVAKTTCTDKKVTSPLILASQAGDEAVIKLLLKTNIDVNDADTEGNTALHWSLKASKGSSEQQIKIIWLLLKHGAQVSQKNMMGLTALHMAAANGNSKVLQVLVLEDQDCIHSKTEMKETPLFFAVKNDHMDCVELLLRWGANSEVLNLRKQRPMDLAKSQDMRFMLNPTNFTLMSHPGPVQQKNTSWLQGAEVISETCEALLTMTEKGTTTDRICSTTKTEVCKYFESPSGCVRGAMCFYAHGEEELQQVKQGAHLNHSPVAKILKRKIFVGGLPPSLDSDSLGEFFEEKFGSVEDAIVLGVEAGNEIKSRGFGFVTFKHEKSVSVAVQTHYVTIMGKRVEIKGVIPKSHFEFQKNSPQQHEQDQKNHYQPQAQMPSEKATGDTPGWKASSEKTKEQMPCWKSPNEKTTEQMPCLKSPTEKPTEEIPSLKTTEKVKPEQMPMPEQMSWVDTLLHGQPKTCSTKSQAHISTSFVDQNIPVWLKTFKKWFPRFLKEVSIHSREGEYALSSLKADFRAACGLDLDHASLGYSKLSEFMRYFSHLCRIVPVGKPGSANHMVLLPSLPQPRKQLFQPTTFACIPSCATPNHDSGNGDSNDSKCSEDLLSVSCENVSFISSSTEEGNPSNLSNDVLEENLGQEDTSPSASGFLQFLKPCLSHSRPLLYNERDGGAGETDNERGALVNGFEGMKLRNQQRHLVLEALARKRNNSSVFFLREFDFYDNYKASISQGKCFGCNQCGLLWANFPCRHLLWCSDCKLQAALAARNFEHKCVLCDVKVQKINLIPSNAYCRSVSGDFHNDEEFSPFDPSHIRMYIRPCQTQALPQAFPSKKKKSPLIGYR